MALEQKDILQINVTVIAGAFIFLSILGTVTSSSIDYNYGSRAVVFALIVIAVFSISSLLSLFEKLTLAKTFMKGGFALLVIFSIMLLVRL
jgi:hypothetical protein